MSNAKPARRTKTPPKSSAARAGLVYVSHHSPGYSRRGAGKRFSYFTSSGKRLTNQADLARIKSLVIPPAWTDIWICPKANGHIQAVGKDARGRLQYRYHPKWRQVRDESKYHRMIGFAKSLPKIRRRAGRHLRLCGLPREKVLAAIVRLLEITLIRIGNEEYAKENKSYGLTTLHDDQVEVHGSRVHFHFRGKSGVQHTVDINDQRLAKIIRTCQDLPEQELFKFIDEAGEHHDISSTQVNDYLHEVSGRDFTAKDFRTWGGTVFAAVALRKLHPIGSPAQAKRNVVAAIKQVAQKLGNTLAVCRKCYIHPLVIDVYLEGRLLERLENGMSPTNHGLPAHEASVLALLMAAASHRNDTDGS